ncbi:unnamed protein product [Rotaria sp. Silwood1]|nr:unnamed protein product [Rotaria sp. Silwood1]CAF1631666.1 unnamed protein product [Rotaria sp. Silwood1]CAF3846563.1 unnamed protein product [Rotaria sp. Silwood1]CAF4816033.1 unnamed protein product [Rotaria sp. Silwood1]
MVKQLQKLSSNSFQSINGLLETAHSLFQQYRYEQKSNELWSKIKLVLKEFTLPKQFEDNVTSYMTYFLTLLSYDHPTLHSNNNDPEILDQVKIEICRPIILYVNNCSDDCKPFAQQLPLAVWYLLTGLDLSSCFDKAKF